MTWTIRNSGFGSLIVEIFSQDGTRILQEGGFINRQMAEAYAKEYCDCLA